MKPLAFFGFLTLAAFEATVVPLNPFPGPDPVYSPYVTCVVKCSFSARNPAFTDSVYPTYETVGAPDLKGAPAHPFSPMDAFEAGPNEAFNCTEYCEWGELPLTLHSHSN